jgi:hypothetical protein
VRFAFPRGVASFVCVLLGGALFLFSIGLAFGWDRGPLSAAGTVIAILGLSIMAGSYWLIRDMDAAPLPAICLKVALGLGSTFLVVGVITLFIHRTYFPMPTGYFFAVGCLCVVALYKFRAYTRDH